MQRICQHPILPIEERETVHITVDGRPVEARAGDTIQQQDKRHYIPPLASLL